MSKEEKLAEYAHDAWAGWIKYMWSKSELDPKSGKIEIPKWAVSRWTRQSNIPYKDLPEDEKESDRKEAKKMIDIFKKEI